MKKYLLVFGMGVCLIVSGSIPVSAQQNNSNSQTGVGTLQTVNSTGSSSSNNRSTSTSLSSSSSSNNNTPAAVLDTSGIRSMEALNMDSGGFVGAGGNSAGFIGAGATSGTSASRSGGSRSSSSRSGYSSSRSSSSSYGNQGSYGAGRTTTEIRTRFVVAFDSPVLDSSSATSQGTASRKTASRAAGLSTRLEKLDSLKRLGSITANVSGREVTLTGLMRTEQDRRLAEQIVLLEPGVSTVRNEITVAPNHSSDNTADSPVAEPKD
ncbi:MAG: BON domain-containing protein [Planctomycetaceae bacterium]|nr:BON domain-containing protein [Planctomycetaceae bacterium]